MIKKVRSAFGLPPWLSRTSEPAQEAPRDVVEYTAPRPADLSDAEFANGWTPETLAEYHTESDARASSNIEASMNRLRRPSRPRYANSKYSPFKWRRNG
jgi:hypothetical protein